MNEATPQLLFAKLRAKALTTPRDVFARRYPGWYLMCKPPSSSGPLGRMAFRTESYDLLEVGDLLRNVPEDAKTEDDLEPLERPRHKHAGSDLEVYSVVKADPNTWPRRILVGRANNNDVVLRYKTVSKLHAHFHFDPTVPPKDWKLTLEDVGSHNGTRLNGRFVKPEKPTKLASGDIVAFGSLKTELLEAAGLYDMLKQLSQSR